MTKRIALKWGIILGVAVCVWTLLLHVLGWYTTDLAKGRAADQVAVIIPLVAIYFAIREQGKGLRRMPTIGESITTGLSTGIVSVPISAGFLWIYHHYINPRWHEYVIAHERVLLSQTGASAEEISRRVERLTASATDSAQFLGAVIGTLVISLVISLIVWGILRFRMRRAPA